MRFQSILVFDQEKRLHQLKMCDFQQMHRIEELQDVHEVEFDPASGHVAATTFRQSRLGKKQLDGSSFDLHVAQSLDHWQTVAFYVRKFEWGSLPTSKAYKEPHFHLPRLFAMVQGAYGAELQVFLGPDYNKKHVLETRVVDFYLKQNTQLIVAVERATGGRKSRTLNHSLVVFDLQQDLTKLIRGRAVYFAKNQSGWLPWIEKENIIYKVLSDYSNANFNFLLNVEKLEG